MTKTAGFLMELGIVPMKGPAPEKLLPRWSGGARPRG